VWPSFVINTAIRLRIPMMPPGHTEVEASTCSDLMPSTVLR
jgi:hypothetical protein